MSIKQIEKMIANPSKLEAGIYAYIHVSSHEVLYIGKDSNLSSNKRHNERIRPDYSKQFKLLNYLEKEFQNVVYTHLAYCPAFLLDEVEKALIHYYKPPLNTEFLESYAKEGQKALASFDNFFKKYKVERQDKKNVLKYLILHGRIDPFKNDTSQSEDK